MEGTQVRAVASTGSNVYFGGNFKTVGGSSSVAAGVAATNIARWDGRSWSAVGGGVNGPIYAIAIRANEVYVGGEFTSAGGVNATNIARWDGTNWSAVGGGILGERVYALAFNDNELYAGGRFTNADGVIAKHIAKWNGASWSSVGAGLGDVGSVRAIAFVGSTMYACGDFHIGSILNIARWDGVNWIELSGDLGNTSDTAYAMAVIGTDLYVGGTFLTANGVDTKRIARWNGSTWSSVGPGITAASVGVFTLVADANDLYAAGQVNGTSGMTTGQPMKWNGTTWSGVGIGIPGTLVVNSLAMSKGELYVGGAFLGVGSGVIHTYNTARWDGTNWWALGQGMDNAILTMANHAGNVYAGGWFSRAGGLFAGNIAAWNGNRWSSIGDMDFLFSEIRAIASGGTNLYVGGTFFSGLTNGSGFSAFSIARWNGFLWTSLGAGLRLNGTNGLVRAIAAAADGTVYAGGIFNQAGGAAATNIARFFTNWQAVGTAPAPGVNGEVLALALAGSDLYFGGAFTSAGGVSATGIARWSGSAWTSVGTGLNGTVMALATNGTDLYASGKFTNTAAGITNIAKWNGSTWSALGAGVGGHTTNDFVGDIAVNGSDVYVGGSFTNAGRILASNIARWNGSAWSALGSGVAAGSVLNPASVRALAFKDGALHVGGYFVSAGGKPSYGFAIWNPPGSTLLQAGAELNPGNNLVITWNTIPGFSYAIRSTTNLSVPFTTFSGPILAIGTPTSYTNSTTTSQVRFFQIEQLPP